MKRLDIPHGEFALPCGASLRVSGEEGITAFFGPGAPTPSRATVTREASALTGLPLWLENWPEDDASRYGPPVLVPRHPALLFATPLARQSGLAPCDDREAFERLSTALAWDGSYQTLAGTALELLSAHVPSGARYDVDDARDLIVALRGAVTPGPAGSSPARLREVVAVTRTSALRDLQIIDSLRRLGVEAPDPDRWK